MSIRLVGGEVGKPLYIAMAPIATFAAATACKVGAHVINNTGDNFAINSCATTTDIRSIGIITALSADKTIATVKWYGYNKCFKATISGTCALGNSILSAGAVTAGGTVKGSANATRALDALCVATAYPASTECMWLAN